MAVPFLVVAAEMLYSCHYALTLHSEYVLHCSLRSQKRVFSVVLEIASAHWCPVDVYSGTEQDVNPACPRV